MITTCKLLGIYPDAIDDAVESCENALKKLGFSDDEISDFYDMAEAELEEIGIWSEITNSIISAFFHTARDMILQKFPVLGVSYYVNCHDSSFTVGDLPGLMTEEEIRADWEKALNTMNYSDISRTIRWGFTPEDLRELMRLHRGCIQWPKIEDLLEDCNFHTFCGCLSEDDYDGAEAEIERIEEENA